MNTLIAISGLGIIVMLAEMLNARKAIVPLTIVGLLVILGFNISEYNLLGTYLNNMMFVDRFSVAFSSLFIIITIFLIAMGGEFYKEKMTRISDFVSIKVFLLAGGVTMVSFGNLAMFFLGIEILSISLYVLAASNRTNLRSNEAGMKYFLMGAFASGIILFGIALIYGATGSFDLQTIYQIIHTTTYPQWYNIGLIFVLIGMLFKVAAAPFHFWSPDVYEGSPALTTATMSTLGKVVSMAALFKLITLLVPFQTYHFQMLVVVVSIASMMIGNIMALRQNNVKRMLAFSGISHAGFMLMTLIVPNFAANILFYYATAYAISGLAIFAIILYVTKRKENETIDLFNGLGKTHPVAALIVTTSLLSMAGIPIFSGFFAKFFLFNQVVNSGWIILVIIAVIASIISVGYYFKLILAMYTKSSNNTNDQKNEIPFVYLFLGIIGLIANLIIGFFPNILLNLIR
ncbi:NADH-quinone oxidoreductase subunit N [Flavobacterium covae]|uniref:NADH-quinone oxidoreductase subunit N n=1 Tax=Flavobacterium covae TaxID=2906076 RepID=UPI000745BBEC|nr:NADH-quinone oxidoreductase subunit N [Flavobacterium covae]OXA76431.1 NADH-quinone oxidoreductase subunit N [Flavobacterium columnare NBRC 100251 = ATCC 23463]AMA48253.1 NADH-quinone oxidoreductase subunit N [Flavobacterium covae]MCJ1806173.1 NADH-quinone oxidoreductase subunit N [Flavobacterium covae]MCJ1808273.1 NADH-quinone oxidoreductase subunit N [Flavobacterium covae]OWP87588.1 NADH-quinone oxidoreductase subunit N [Flavobacterium covae]